MSDVQLKNPDVSRLQMLEHLAAASLLLQSDMHKCVRGLQKHTKHFILETRLPSH